MFTHDGYINEQFRTSGIPYGCQNSDENGCGWISVFNTLRLLDERPPTPAEVAQGMSRGVILGGYLGTWPLAIVRFLRRRGFSVRWSMRKSQHARIAGDSDAAIYLYLGPHLIPWRWREIQAHYIMIHPPENGRCRILNYGSDSHRYSLKSLLGEYSEHILTVMIGVKKPSG